MSWQDRPYAGGGDYDDGYGGSGGMGASVLGGMSKPPKAVKWLLIINFAVFFIQLITGDLSSGGKIITRLFAVTGESWWQLWRLVSFQFLHGGPWHIGFNMLGLYFLGSPLERKFGNKWFLKFYLVCGVFAGVSYAVMALLWNSPMSPLVGASGGVFGIILAAAVYFPHMRLIMLFFPVPIRTAVTIIFSIMIIYILMGIGGDRTGQTWSSVAHFGGAATAAVWLYFRHNRPVEAAAANLKQKSWDKKMQSMRDLQKQADKILEKVHQKGIQSLSSREKSILKKATELQKQREREFKNL